MKYERLTPEELEAAEKEFIEFLIINGITADDWEKLKKEKPQDASSIVDSFSDVMYESWLRKTHYLEMIMPQEIMSFHYQSDQAVLVGLRTTDPSVDFTKMDDLSNLSVSDDTFELFTQSKSYRKSREKEVYEMIKRGAKPSDGKLFKVLCLGLG